MKMEEAVGVIERSNVGEERKFNIKATGKAFKALSDTLYSDKVGSIVRELSSNAYDSHKLAGNESTPFEVYAPSRLNPNFIVRDYGVGLSEEDVYDVYTTYFESTKSQSNDFIGCFGLGSKSPFAYTDSFMVTSYYNGRATTYSMFLNESSEPSIIKLNECSTSEPNGLRVEVPVNNNDCYEFCDKISKAYSYYKVQPKVAGVELAKLPVDGKDSIVVEGEGFKAIYDQWTSQTNRIIVGNVEYPLTFANIPRYGITLYVNIGEVEVTLSREKISYSPKTVEYIRQRVDAIRVAVSKYVQEQVDKCDCYYDACAVSIRYNNLTGTNMPYKGRNIIALTSPRSIEAFDKKKVRFGLVKESRNHNYTISYSKEDATVFYPKSVNHFIIDDVNNKHLALRLKNNCKGKSFIVVENGSPSKDFINELFGILDRHWVLASTLTFVKPPPKPKVVNPVKVDRNSVYTFNPNSYRVSRSWVKADTLSNVITHPNVGYVKLSGYKTNHNFDKFKAMCKTLISLDNTIKIYGVRTDKALETIQKTAPATWKPIDDLMKDVAEKIVENGAINYTVTSKAKEFFKHLKDKDSFADKVYNAIISNVSGDDSRRLDSSKWYEYTSKTERELTKLYTKWPVLELVKEARWNLKFSQNL